MMHPDRENIFAPGKLWSLWDLMKIFDGKRVFESILSLNSLVNTWNEAGLSRNPLLWAETFATYRSHTEVLIDALESFGLRGSIPLLKQFLEELNKSILHTDGSSRILRGQNLLNAVAAFNRFEHVLIDEMESIVLIRLSIGNEDKFNDGSKLFGERVELAFPYAVLDLNESGKCLSLGRPTATVFHLMRAMESTVAVLARKLSATARNAQGETLPWGILISNIKVEIDKLPKGADQDEWYKVHAMLHSVNRAFRTKTAHPEKSYSMEEAEGAFDACKSFMRQLAGMAIT